MDEDPIIEEWLHGDEKKGGELVGEYGEFVYRVCRRESRSADEAADWAWEAWKRILNGLRHRNPGMPLKSWIWIRTYGVCGIQTEADPDLEPDTSPEKSTSMDRLRWTLNKLSPRSRNLLILKYVEDFTHGELAAALGINSRKVDEHLLSALKELDSFFAT